MTQTDDRRTAGLALICDPEGRIREVVSDGLGLTAYIGTGDAFAALFDAACTDKAATFLEEMRRRGAIFDWELVVRDAGGRLSALHFAGARTGRGFLVVGAVSRSDMVRLCEELLGSDDEQARGMSVGLRDISARMREQPHHDIEVFEELTRLNNDLAAAYREMAKKNAELERLNQQKNQWLGIAAHDLRDPLGVIMLYGQFLLDDAGQRLEPEHVEFIRRIVRSSQFMLNLVNDLLDVSQIEAGRLDLNLTEVDLDELVARNVELNRILAGQKQITIIYEQCAAGMRTRLDPTKIEQVLNNLIINAVKFSPQGSRIHFRLDRDDAGRALLSVEDEGPGIPADEVEKLFRPFGRTRVQATGGEKSTGLGLAIAKRIVEGHGGHIRVEASPAGSARFVFTLPLTSDG